MTEKEDVGSAVTLLIKEHGQDAVGVVEQRIMEHSLEGDLEQFQFWVRVKRAVLEYLSH